MYVTMKLKLQFGSLLVGNLINVVYELRTVNVLEIIQAIQGEKTYFKQNTEWCSALRDTETY